MYPVLIDFGAFRIYTYGVMIALGLLVGIILATRRARREGIDANKILDTTFYALIAALLGSRLLFVLFYLEDYLDAPFRILKLWEGGLVFYGGLIPAVIVGLWYITRSGLPIWQTADIFAPSIAIGHGLGRLGCFFAGCCYGKECNLPWAITFTDPRGLGPLGVSVHPTQLYESLFLLCLFVFLVLLRRHKRFHGELLWIYVLSYSVGRFLIEFLRGDYRGPWTAGVISTTQVVALVSGGISVAMLLYLRKKAERLS